MFKKKDFVISSIAIYGLLVTLLISRVEKKSFHTPCFRTEPCVRFCCYNSSLCNETFIKDNFNVTSNNDSLYNLAGYKILRGTPVCSLQEVSSKEFEKTWIFVAAGDISLNHETINIDNYCLEKSTSTDYFGWNLYVCEKSLDVAKTVNVITSIISFLFFSAAVFVYAYFKELKTTPGKSFLFLVSSLWLINISLTVIKGTLNFLPGDLKFFAFVTVSLGFIFSLLWSFVLSFDIWWTFKNFRMPTDDSRRFMSYFMSVFGFVVLIILTIWYIDIFIFIFLTICAFLDFIFLILTAVNIFRLSRSLNSSESSRFDTEKDRFWSYVQLKGILLITWPIEIMVFTLKESYGELIVSDLIKCFSSILIFVIFVLRKNVRILLRNSMRNTIFTSGASHNLFTDDATQ